MRIYAQTSECAVVTTNRKVVCGRSKRNMISKSPGKSRSPSRRPTSPKEASTFMVWDTSVNLLGSDAQADSKLLISWRRWKTCDSDPAKPRQVDVWYSNQSILIVKSEDRQLFFPGYVLGWFSDTACNFFCGCRTRYRQPGLISILLPTTNKTLEVITEAAFLVLWYVSLLQVKLLRCFLRKISFPIKICSI